MILTALYTLLFFGLGSLIALIAWKTIVVRNCAHDSCVFKET